MTILLNGAGPEVLSESPSFGQVEAGIGVTRG